MGGIPCGEQLMSDSKPRSGEGNSHIKEVEETGPNSLEPRARLSVPFPLTKWEEGRIEIVCYFLFITASNYTVGWFQLRKVGD